jgi:hypothetical protein
VWQSQVKEASVDQEAYSKALAGVYLDLICSGDGDALSVVRSLASMGIREDGSEPKPPFSGFLETGREVKGLVKTIMSEKCRVSTLLSDADKALLFAVEKIQLPPADAAEGPRSSTPPQ